MKTSPPIENISAEALAIYLQKLTDKRQFAVFELPKRTSFAQVRRSPSGGLYVEVSQRTPALEALLGTLGEVTFVDGYGFPATTSAAGDDSRAAQVVAQALAVMAADAAVANMVRVRTG